MTDALAAISVRIGELEARLAASPIYRELTILCKARDDLRKLSDSGAGSAKDVANAPNVGPKRITILEGVRLALTEKGHPMSSAELVESLPQFGARVGGKRPRLNITSILSKRGGAIVSVRWQSKHGWWFHDQPLPGEESEGGPAMASPSDSNDDKGGLHGTALALDAPTVL